MAVLKWRILHFIYKCCCVMVAVGLSVYLGRDFYEDNDLSEVQMKHFHQDEQSIYPDFTICFPNRYYETKLSKYGKGINASTYASFLDGDLWDYRMVHISYDDVSMKLSDILLEVCARSAFDENCQSTGVYTSMPIGGSSICFTFQTSQLRLNSFSSFGLKIKSSVFQDKVRPTRFIDPRSGVEKGMMVWFHHHNNKFGSGVNLFAGWPFRSNASSKYYVMHFQIKGLETFEKRSDKRCSPCNDVQTESYDIQKIKSIIEKVKCSPMYWERITDYPLCSSKEEMKKILRYHYEEILHPSQKSTDIDPCLTIIRSDVEYIEEDIFLPKEELLDEEWFFISIEHMTDTFKHIKQIPAISLCTLFGIVGGYFSLFVGLAILDLPKKWSEMFKIIKADRNKDESLKDKTKKEHILVNRQKTSAFEPCSTV